jgi:putative transposase
VLPAQGALNDEERQAVLDAMHSMPLADKAPAEASATLLDEGKYRCSIRTMYRIRDANKEVRERRNPLRHPTLTKPQLVATAPNQVCSWDITKLLGPNKWTQYPLYVVIDIYSRYVVGWMLAHRECQYLAERLLRETAIKEQIRPYQLTLHADLSAAMTSRPVSRLIAFLGVSRSYSRPHTSNDTPYSEYQFKTIKRHPDSPNRFEEYHHALDCSRQIIDWYNHHHRHWNVGLLTPAAVHIGAAGRILNQRRVILEEAYALHPKRFVRGIPRPSRPAAEAWINPPENVAIRRAIQLPRDTGFVTQLSQSH